MLERLFKLRENNTNARTEVVSGLITFFSMSYILVVNPAVLSATKFRESLIDSIPNNLKYGISAAIGLFIAFLGLKNSALIVANPHTILSLGDLKKLMFVFI